MSNTNTPAQTTSVIEIHPRVVVSDFSSVQKLTVNGVAFIRESAAPVAAPAGPGVRGALKAIVQWERDEKRADYTQNPLGFVEALQDLTLLTDAAQLALDQEPDAEDLVASVSALLDWLDRDEGIMRGVPTTQKDLRKNCRAALAKRKLESSTDPDAGELVKALESIEQMLNVDDAKSYASDDPHGAIETSYDTAKTALAAWKGGVK